MKRIVSKIDYDMYKLGQNDPKLALKLWYRICKNKTLINLATEVIEDKNGNKCFLAPSICHMILSNPWDVQKEDYDALVLKLLNDYNLNKICVFDNMTFLYLIILNGALGFDDWYLELVNKNIINKTYTGNFEMRQVIYKDVIDCEEELVQYKSEDVNVSLSPNMINELNTGSIFDIQIIKSFEEAKKLFEISELFSDLDERVTLSIKDLFNYGNNYQKYNALLRK